MASLSNIFSQLPHSFEQEQFDDLLNHDSVRIERIVSKGHTSPSEGWYDQSENEWVIVLEGSGCVEFENECNAHVKAW